MTKIRNAPRVNNRYTMFPRKGEGEAHLPYCPWCEHRELLCANVALCVEETGTNRMCVAQMHGSHVCKEHLCVQYTNYTLRPLENSKSRINTDWSFLLFDFSCGPAQVLSSPDSTAFHPCAIMGAAPFSGFCWPATFLLYKCDCFSEVDIKHYPGLVLLNC